MSMSGRPFDWHGFWSDFLGSAGRGLLELDGSREANVALSALDHFALAQRQRRDEELALRRAQAAAVADEVERDPGAEQFDPDGTQEVAWEAGDIGRSSLVAVAGLTPSQRPRPLSADPYDHPGLPVRLQLGPHGLLRRR
jgi:hypothetical protein